MLLRRRDGRCGELVDVNDVRESPLMCCKRGDVGVDINGGTDVVDGVFVTCGGAVIFSSKSAIVVKCVFDATC